jgi:hypothetical protein
LSRAGIDARVVLRVSRWMARCSNQRIRIAMRTIARIRSGFTITQ